MLPSPLLSFADCINTALPATPASFAAYGSRGTRRSTAVAMCTKARPEAWSRSCTSTCRSMSSNWRKSKMRPAARASSARRNSASKEDACPTSARNSHGSNDAATRATKRRSAVTSLTSTERQLLTQLRPCGHHSSLPRRYLAAASAAASQRSASAAESTWAGQQPEEPQTRRASNPSRGGGGTSPSPSLPASPSRNPLPSAALAHARSARPHSTRTSKLVSPRPHVSKCANAPAVNCHGSIAAKVRKRLDRTAEEASSALPASKAMCCGPNSAVICRSCARAAIRTLAAESLAARLHKAAVASAQPISAKPGAAACRTAGARSSLRRRKMSTSGG
mmetsp:Transcript_37066/g.106992  ORF Transcript_37066/g.106992 Transcript_37066/m.106992 type:complete len:336 (-) Transcript_37066:337-1344(-)